jgi:oxygen-independent coproporphyrinogen III oxidase
MNSPGVNPAPLRFLRPEADPAHQSPDFDALVRLIRQYDKPGPRYTSYPTAVEFHERFDEVAYRRQLALAAESDAPLSLYLHLPFCEERCSFCGCSVIITKKRDVAVTYLDYLHRELEMLGRALAGRRRVVQYHWGGGTPTYLSVEQIAALQRVVTTHFDIQPGAEVAIEVDPRVTSIEQLQLLRQLGFNRLSLGVQDFTPEVQAAVNRIQPETVTRALFDAARQLGFESINVDLIYGLPLQTRRSFGRAVDTVIRMRPDRVAVYSFAHVPWIRGHQKRLNPTDLPVAERKIELFVEAMERFTAAGYQQIGMDHFALPDDELARASAAGRLHRNFMGYTTRPAPDMIGAGVSSIGDVSGAFAQNTKKLSTYYAALDAGRFPIERGYLLDADDHVRRHVIAELMCNFRVDMRQVERRFNIGFVSYFAGEIEELASGPARDGFVRIGADVLEVTPLGRLFVRNVAMLFDRHLRARASEKPVFSRTI